MNDRIKELALQATEIVEITDHCSGKSESTAQVNLAKFAELIVRECIGCCEQVISDPVPKSVDTWLNGGEQCIQEIKQHFGIRE